MADTRSSLLQLARLALICARSLRTFSNRTNGSVQNISAVYRAKVHAVTSLSLKKYEEQYLTAIAQLLQQR